MHSVRRRVVTRLEPNNINTHSTQHTYKYRLQLHDVCFMNARPPLPRALIADGTVVTRAALSSSKTPSTSTDSTALMLPLLTNQTTSLKKWPPWVAGKWTVVVCVLRVYPLSFLQVCRLIVDCIVESVLMPKPVSKNKVPYHYQISRKSGMDLCFRRVGCKRWETPSHSSRCQSLRLLSLPHCQWM